MAVFGLEDLTVLNGKLFLIYPSENSCFTPLGYDLRIGKHIVLSHHGEGSILHDDDNFVFPPNSANLIITKERVWLSGYVMASIHSRGSLAARGLFINSTTVDPHWNGTMIMRIYNSSPREEKIPKGKAFATMVIHSLRSKTLHSPATDPLRVSSRLIELYGDRIGSQLHQYENSSNVKSDKLAFDGIVDSAKFYLRLPSVIRAAINFIKKLRRYRASRNNFIKIISLSSVSAALPYIIDVATNGSVLNASNKLSIYIPFSFTIFGAIYAINWFRNKD